MKFAILLSFITLPFLSGCQHDKMDANHLTTANVIRVLSPANVKVDSSAKTPAKEIAPEVKTVSPAKPAVPTKSYHIIVASHPNEKLAQADVTRLKAQGYNDAQVITKDQRYRVSIANDPDKQKAMQKREELTRRLKREDIWITPFRNK